MRRVGPGNRGFDMRGGVMAVTTTLTPQFSASAPRLLFNTTGLALQDFYRSYDIAPDGNRFLMVQSGGLDVDNFSVVINWMAEIQRVERCRTKTSRLMVNARS